MAVARYAAALVKSCCDFRPQVLRAGGKRAGAEAPDRGTVRAAREGAGPTSGPSAATRRPVHGYVGGGAGRGAAGRPAVGLESPRVGRSEHLRAHNVECRAPFDETRIRRGARRWPGTPPGRLRASGGAHKIGHHAVVRSSYSNIFSKHPLHGMARRGCTVVSGTPHVLVVVRAHTAQTGAARGRRRDARRPPFWAAPRGPRRHVLGLPARLRAGKMQF